MKAEDEIKSLWSQIGTANNKTRALPFVFTKQGVAMLSATLRTEVAEEINIAIINSFVVMRRNISSNLYLKYVTFLHKTYKQIIIISGDYMSNFLYAFILSSLAGLSTLIGLIPIFFKIKNKNKIICASLAFASGVMICVSITDLIPESYNLLTTIFKGFPSLLFLLIFFTCGVILSMLIDKFLPDSNKEITNKKLFRLGIVSMLAIIMHNIPEGIATFLSASENKTLGLSLAIAISLHNIPEGISIAVPVYFSTKSKKRAFLYTFISCLSEPLGAILAFLFLAPIMNNFIMSILLSMIAGIMIHISCYELLKESLTYKMKKTTIIFFIIGFIFMGLSHILMG